MKRITFFNKKNKGIIIPIEYITINGLSWPQKKITGTFTCWAKYSRLFCDQFSIKEKFLINNTIKIVVKETEHEVNILLGKVKVTGLAAGTSVFDNVPESHVSFEAEKIFPKDVTQLEIEYRK